MDSDPAAARPWRGVRILAGVTAVVVGLGLIVLVTALGHCSSFGGRCPADPPPLLEDDVFGSAAAGGFLAVALPLWLSRPSRRQLRVAVAAGIVAGFAIGLLARSAAAG